MFFSTELLQLSENTLPECKIFNRSNWNCPKLRQSVLEMKTAAKCTIGLLTGSNRPVPCPPAILTLLSSEFFLQEPGIRNWEIGEKLENWGSLRLRSELISSETEMASSTSKTLTDFFQPAKRLKASPSASSSSFPAVGGSRGVGTDAKSPPRTTVTNSVADDSSGLTSDQISRSEFNKFAAKSKRNLAVCSGKVSKAKGLTFNVVPPITSSTVSFQLKRISSIWVMRNFVRFWDGNCS